MEDVAQILDALTGIVPDDGKSLDEYREERLRERYGDFCQSERRDGHSGTTVPARPAADAGAALDDPENRTI